MEPTAERPEAGLAIDTVIARWQRFGPSIPRNPVPGNLESAARRTVKHPYDYGFPARGLRRVANRVVML